MIPRRIIKQVVYGLFYLVVFSGIGYGIYFGVKGKNSVPPSPPSQPKDVEIIWARGAEQTTGFCDLVAKIKNPNPNHFLPQLTYEFFIYQGPNIDLASQKEGTDWLLPIQEKYLIENQVPCPEDITRLILKIKTANWQKLTEYSEPQIQVSQREYQKLNQGPPFAQVSAVVANKNDFALSNIWLNMILEDERGDFIAGRRTKIDYLASQQEQKVNYQWLTEVKKDVFHLIIEPDIKINDVFLK